MDWQACHLHLHSSVLFALLQLVFISIAIWIEFEDLAYGTICLYACTNGFVFALKCLKAEHKTFINITFI